MNGYISYPSYPKSFKAKRKLFNKVSKHKIDEYIHNGISKIILEHELGRGESEMEYSYILENVEVKVTCVNGIFHAYVTENDTTYDAPIEAKIEFDYAEDEYDREWKIRRATHEEYRMAEQTKEYEERNGKLMANLMFLGVLVGFVSGLFIFSKLI